MQQFLNLDVTRLLLIFRVNRNQLSAEEKAQIWIIGRLDQVNRLINEFYIR